MAKQEIIREELEVKINRFDTFGEEYSYRGFAEEILSYLDSQWVVLKVKCSDCVWGQFGDETVGMTPCYRCNSTGYIMEPLIKEE